MKDLSIEKTNDYLIVNSSLGSFETETSDDEFYGIEGNIENYSKSSLQKENIPTSFKVKEEESRKFIARKVDYFKKAKNQKKLGLLGELMVLQYEVDFLKDNGREKLADKVKHISETDGDGAGYDILSFDMDGSEKYIEVKTTSGGRDTPFNITDNEIEFSKLKTSNYYLYRVYDYDMEKNEAKFYEVNGDLTKKLNLKPETYIANGIIEY